MGRKSRDLRERLEWLEKYSKEATKIIVDVVSNLNKNKIFLPAELLQRMNRLKQASMVWDVIQKTKEQFVP